MIFNVTKTSDWQLPKELQKPVKVKINSLEELIKFIQTNEGQVIISTESEDKEVNLEIYDDFRE